MPQSTSPTTDKFVSDDIANLHDRCGVYTRAETVNKILDSVRWTHREDLSEAQLLEPASGDGAFVAEAASRLLRSMRNSNLRLSAKSLIDRIVAFELHPVEADKAQRRIIEVLVVEGLSIPSARKVAASWIRCEDFLLAELPEAGFTHIVGNPPYARWSSIPEALRQSYEKKLPGRMARGDLFLPFLDLSIGYLRKDARLGFVCSDRWKFMGFAEEFRRDRLPDVDVEIDEKVEAANVYVRDVDAYPTLLVIKRRKSRKARISSVARTSRKTLGDAGYRIRVGPALGCTPAFVLEPGEEENIEPELLARWVDGSEVQESHITWRGRHVMALYDDAGKLRDLDDFPLAKARLESYRPQLMARAVVDNGAVWYRPIDRVMAVNWCGPKLLVPELAKVPRLALDESGAIPSHGVYAIFRPDGDLGDLYELLRDGGLAQALDGIAPQVKGGFVRCYKRFLERICLD